MSDRYLVTGGCGFIGSHLCEHLVRAGHDVRVLDNLSSGYERNLAGVRDGVDLRIGDIRDAAAVHAAMQDVDYVFHEAALVSVFDSVARPVDNHEINLTGTLRVLEAGRAAGIKRLVMASSAAVYGNDPTLPKQESMRPQPESPYALAKITAEYMLSVYAAHYGVPTVALRYFNVFGPRQDPGSPYSGVISQFSDQILKGEGVTIFGDGKQTRDFVFVSDVVAANMLAMRDSAGAGEVFNVASGRTASLLDLAAVLGELAGRAVDITFDQPRAGDIRHSSASIDLITERLGYEPRFDLQSGLAELWASLQVS